MKNHDLHIPEAEGHCDKGKCDPQERERLVAEEFCAEAACHPRLGGVGKADGGRGAQQLFSHRKLNSGFAIAFYRLNHTRASLRQPRKTHNGGVHKSLIHKANSYSVRPNPNWHWESAIYNTLS